MAQSPEAQVVFGERFAKQLFVGLFAAGRNLIDERREQLDGLLEVVGAVGQDAAIELRLIGRKPIELLGHAKELVIGEQVLQAGIGVDAA